MRIRRTGKGRAWLGLALLLVAFTVNTASALSLRDSLYNGVWQDYGSGWQYCYYTGSDTAQWKYQNNFRFSYSYGPGQWSNYDVSGIWNAIGGSGMSTAFIGDGGWYDMKDGFVFNYSAVRDKGHWGRTDVLGSTFRFAYYYGTGQWLDCDKFANWHTIGGTGATGAFIGDGGWYDMKNGFTFNYSVSRDIANWTEDSMFRFNYSYQLAKWKDCDKFNAWHFISGTGANGGFIGDGGWYDMKNGFTFNYSATLDRADWARDSAFRFIYEYDTAQWLDCDKFNTCNFISWAGANGGFIGDGGWYDMKNGFIFQYSAKLDRANWARGSEFRFIYDYKTAQWKNSDKLFGTWRNLSAVGANGGCIGDGNWYDLKNGFTFNYSVYLDKGYWAENAASRFAYEFTVGQWWDYDYAGIWNTLGSAGISSAFVGDRQFHNLGLHDNYWFQYWYDNNAYYATLASGQFTDKFFYKYSNGQWGYIITNRWESLGPSGQSSQFASVGMGDVGLRWAFASGIDPSVFGFNPANTIDAFIKFDANGDGSLDRVLYFDDVGHKVAEGEITAGSMGIRIAVDKSYVAAGNSWSDSWSYWSESTPYSPLVFIYDAAGNQLFKQYLVQYISAIGSGPVMRDGEAWIWEDTNGNGRYDSNWTASGDQILHWRQQKGGTCGLFAPMNIVESVKGNGPNQVTFGSSFPDDLIQWFSDTFSSSDQQLYHRFNPPYDRNTMDLHDPFWVNYGNVYAQEQTEYMTTAQGFQNPLWARGSTSTWENFVNQVESGKLALTMVDAYSIWAYVFPLTDSKGQPRDANHDFYLDAGYDVTGLEVNSGIHWVWVTGFQRDAAGNITNVVIEDSAQMLGAVGLVPVEHFKRGWERNNVRQQTFYDPPSGYTWSAAGAETWKFNPQVWSLTW